MARFNRHWSSLTSVPVEPLCRVGRAVERPQTTLCAASDVPWVAHFFGWAAHVFSAAQVFGPIWPSTLSAAQRWNTRTRASVAAPKEPSAPRGVYRLALVARFSSHWASAPSAPVAPCFRVGWALVCPHTATAAAATGSATTAAVAAVAAGNTSSTATARASLCMASRLAVPGPRVAGQRPTRDAGTVPPHRTSGNATPMGRGWDALLPRDGPGHEHLRKRPAERPHQRLQLSADRLPDLRPAGRAGRANVRTA